MKYRFDEIAINSTSKKIPVDSDKEHYIGLEHLDSCSLTVTRWGAEVAPVGEKLLMKKGDVLFGKRRAYQRKVGIAPFDGIFSAHGMVLRPNERIVTKEFFPFFISSDQFMERAVRISVGGLSPTINWKDLKIQEFDLPSIEEQRVLADKLWAAYRLKESYRRLLTTTQEMVKSQFIEMFGDPIRNSKGWDVSPIQDVAPETPSETKLSGNVWMLNLDMIESDTGKVLSKVYSHSDDLLSVAPFDEDNVLFSKLRPYLNKVVIPDDKGYATTELVPLKPQKEKLNKIFFSHLLRSDEFVSYANGIATGTKMPRMPLTDLRKFKVILPPMPLQEQFVAIAEQADKSEFDEFKSQFIEMFGKVYNGRTPYSKVFRDETKKVTKIPASEYAEQGNFPIYDQSTDKIIAGYTSVKDNVCYNFPVILFGDHSRVIKYIEEPYYIGADGVKIIKCASDDILPKFAYYLLKYEKIPNTGYNRHYKWLKEKSYSIPPLPLQKQFVAIAE